MEANVIDFHELMRIFSLPRPNGSAALKETCQTICNWLTLHRIPHRRHAFRVYPYFLETFGAWLLISQGSLTLGLWLRWGWPTLVIGLTSLVPVILEMVCQIPLICRIGTYQGENIIIEFDPPRVQQELILGAHYDSKTELLDHHKRALFMNGFPLVMILMPVLGILGFVDGFLGTSESPWANTAFYVGIALSIPQLFLACGLGLNIILGRFVQPSQGVVDNGAACAILLGLAHTLNQSVSMCRQTRVTLAIFAGEEIAMQGSRAYVADCEWSVPTVMLNLEIMGQNGEYVIWARDGSPIEQYATSPALNAAVSEAVTDITGTPVQILDEASGTDAYPFLKAGIPATSLATFDRELKDGGLHRPTDNLERITIERLTEGVEIATHFLRQFDRGERVLDRPS